MWADHGRAVGLKDCAAGIAGCAKSVSSGNHGLVRSAFGAQGVERGRDMLCVAGAQFAGD